MAHFDIDSVISATDDKVDSTRVKAAPKPCKSDECTDSRIPRSVYCQTHKEEADLAKVERVKNYRNVIREAMTLANHESDSGDSVYLRLSDGRSGFAYFVRESLPNFVVKSELGGTVLELDSLAIATAFAGVLNSSDVASSEGWKVQLVATVTPESVDGWHAQATTVLYDLATS